MGREVGVDLGSGAVFWIEVVGVERILARGGRCGVLWFGKIERFSAVLGSPTDLLVGGG